MCDLLWADPFQDDLLSKKLSDSEYEEVSVCLYMYMYVSLWDSVFVHQLSCIQSCMEVWRLQCCLE